MALATERDAHQSSTYAPGNITTSVTRIPHQRPKYGANDAATAAASILATVPEPLVNKPRPNTGT